MHLRQQTNNVNFTFFFRWQFQLQQCVPFPNDITTAGCTVWFLVQNQINSESVRNT